MWILLLKITIIVRSIELFAIMKSISFWMLLKDYAFMQLVGNNSWVIARNT